MTRREVLTAIEQNRGKDLFLISEEILEDSKNLMCIERVSKTTILRNAKRIDHVRCSTFGKEKFDEGWGQWYDEIVVFDTRKET